MWPSQSLDETDDLFLANNKKMEYRTMLKLCIQVLYIVLINIKHKNAFVKRLILSDWVTYHVCLASCINSQIVMYSIKTFCTKLQQEFYNQSALNSVKVLNCMLISHYRLFDELNQMYCTWCHQTEVAIILLDLFTFHQHYPPTHHQNQERFADFKTMQKNCVHTILD